MSTIQRTRILVVAFVSCPDLRVAKEIGSMRKIFRNRLEILDTTNISLQDFETILQRLMYTKDIVHFILHGDETSIALNDKISISAIDLKRIFKPVVQNNLPRLIVFNTCCFGQCLDGLRNIAQNLIGFEKELGDTAALKFTKEFYTRLAENYLEVDAFKIVKDLQNIKEFNPVMKSN